MWFRLILCNLYWVRSWSVKHTHTYTHFLHTLYRPKSDTCKTCDRLTNQIKHEDDSDTLRFELQPHQTRAQRAYQQLKEDTAVSKLDQTVDMFTFDLQQSLPTPKISKGIVFYKRHPGLTTLVFTLVMEKDLCSCGPSRLPLGDHMRYVHAL